MHTRRLALRDLQTAAAGQRKYALERAEDGEEEDCETGSAIAPAFFFPAHHQFQIQNKSSPPFSAAATSSSLSPPSSSDKDDKDARAGGAWVVFSNADDALVGPGEGLEEMEMLEEVVEADETKKGGERDGNAEAEEEADEEQEEDEEGEEDFLHKSVSSSSLENLLRAGLCSSSSSYRSSVCRSLLPPYFSQFSFFLSFFLPCQPLRKFLLRFICRLVCLFPLPTVCLPA